MVVKVTCLKNKHVVVYHDCERIEKGMFWDDDLECLIAAHKLFLANDETATFRNGFRIEMYCNEWEYENEFSRLNIVV